MKESKILIRDTKIKLRSLKLSYLISRKVLLNISMPNKNKYFNSNKMKRIQTLPEKLLNLTHTTNKNTKT